MTRGGGRCGRRRTPPGRFGSATRGQTMIDYAIGAGIFLVAVAAVFVLSPAVLDPFTSEQEHVQEADRIASQLAGDLLGDPSEPYLLDDACTEEFFDADGATGGCRFAADAADVETALNPEGRINVTIEGASGVVDGTAGPLRAGPTPPSGAESVVVAQRSVVFDRRTYRLFVRVW